MLRQSTIVRAALIVAIASIACSCANRPGRGVVNMRDDLVQDQSLVITNAMPRPLRVLPPPGSSSLAEIRLGPTESKVLKFTISREHNTGDAGDRQLVLVAERSSPYLRQSVNDLLLRVRVDNDRPKDARISIGDCLFQKLPPPQGYTVRLQRLPLPGIPVADLCSN